MGRLGEYVAKHRAKSFNGLNSFECLMSDQLRDRPKLHCRTAAFVSHSLVSFLLSAHTQNQLLVDADV